MRGWGSGARRRSPTSRVTHLDRRYQTPVELAEAVAAEGVDLVEAALGLLAEDSGIDPVADWCEAARLVDAVTQEQRCATVVAVAQVVESDADLEDALIQVADRVGLRAPEVFKDLVTFVVFAGIEEADSFDHARWCRLGTAWVWTIDDA